MTVPKTMKILTTAVPVGGAQPADAALAATPRKVGLFLGSLRRASIGAALGRALPGISPAHLTFVPIAIGEIPFYNEDHEGQAPASWLTLRESIRCCDAVLFITPEYNRSVPAALKNAIDVASRPKGKSAWDGRPAAIITYSPGNFGGYACNHHLRQTFACLNMPTLATPEVYLSACAKLLDASGAIANEDTRAFLVTAMSRFARWIETNGTWRTS
jgi:chromate reductase, NAD(P)H dehydrogenase (quinone)